MVMSEMESPRDTFVLMRGSYDKPGAKVEPAVPSFLPPMPANAPRNALAWRAGLLIPRILLQRAWL